MPQARSLVSKFSFALAAYLIILIPAAVYYYFYTESQKEYFSARNFRQLWVMSEQLRFTLSNYRNVLENAATEHDPRRYLSRFVKELIWVEGVDARPGQGFFLRPIVENGEWMIRLSYHGNNGSGIVADRVAADMIERFPGARVFDHIMLASDPKTIIYQNGTTGLRFTSLESLGLPGKPGEAPLRGASRLYSRVMISGEPYEIYLQPMPVGDAGDKTAPAEWTLCALVRSKTFLTESLAISYDVIISFLSICFLILLTLPLLRFRNLSGWESVGLRDIVVVFACSCSFAGVFVLFGLHVFHYELREPQEMRLEPLAEDIASKFQTELREISSQLRSYCDAPDLWDQVARHAPFRRSPGWKPNALPAPAQQETSTLITARTYPWLKFVVWADEAGWQWIKWDVRASVTPFINIAERINGLKNSDPWELPAKQGETMLPFRLELVFSQNTGEYIANYVVRTKDCMERSVTDGLRREIYHNDPLIRKGFAYVATELRSALTPILPPDTGFAIVDETGKTLVHSEAVRNQWENFLVESDDDGRLRAAISSRGTTSLNLRYKGTEHDLFVMPLEGIPFSLVVFRDNANLNTMHLETQTLSAFLLVSFLFCLTLAGTALLRLTSRAYPARWIWPDENLAAVYSGNTVLNVLLTILVCFWTVFARSAELYFAVVVIGSLAFFLNIVALMKHRAFAFRGWLPLALVAGVLLLCFVLFTDPRHALLLGSGLAVVMLIGGSPAVRRWMERPARISYTASYGLAAATLICAVGIVPAFACFRIAHDLEMELLIRSAQIDISRKVVSRIADAYRKHEENREVRYVAFSQGQDVTLPVFRRDDVLRWRYFEHLLHTTLSFPSGEPEAFPTETGSGFQRFLARMRVAYNRGVSHTSGIPLSERSQNWRWASGPWPRLQYWDQSEGGASRRFATIVSTDFHPLIHLTRGTLREAAPVLLVWTALGGLAFAFALASLRWVARSLAMPEMAVLGMRAEPVTAAAAASGNRSGTDSIDDWQSANLHLALLLEGQPNRDRILALFQRECGVSGVLRQIGAGLLRDPGFHPPNEAALQHAILEACEGHYDGLWKRLSSQQRFVLYRLAVDGMVNPANHAILYSLLRAGLIIATPRFEIFNDTFRTYILRHIDPEEATLWASEKAKKPLAPTRVLVIVMVAAMIGFLFFTQPELLQTSVGFFTALAAAIGALMKLLPSSQEQKPAAES